MLRDLSKDAELNELMLALEPSKFFLTSFRENLISARLNKIIDILRLLKVVNLGSQKYK